MSIYVPIFPYDKLTHKKHQSFITLDSTNTQKLKNITKHKFIIITFYFKDV